MKKSLNYCILAAFVSASLLSACKTDKRGKDDSLQITEKDVVRLEGSVYDNFLDSWEYVILEDDDPKALLGYVEGIQYDDGLFFIKSSFPGIEKNQVIKVYDSNGRYLNDIGGVGRARNEYLYLNRWILDTYRNEVLIINPNGGFGLNAIEVKRYDYQGNFLGETSSDKMDTNHVTGDLAKCASDGTLTFINPALFIIPTVECTNIHSDGRVTTPFEPNGFLLHCDMTADELMNAGDIPAANIIGPEFFTPTSDTTYLMRILDNHIYRLIGDSTECIANMSFRPDLPEKKKRDYKDPEYDGYSPDLVYDLDKYLYMCYWEEGIYLFEKGASKLYFMEHDTVNVSIPEFGFRTVYGNDMIFSLETNNLQEILEDIDNKESSQRYTPEVKDFYRKIRKCENPPIIIAHYK